LIRHSPSQHPTSVDLAVQHHHAGRLREAEQLYRQILAQQPRHDGALHYLSVIAQHAGRSEIAVDLIRQALTTETQLPSSPLPASHIWPVRWPGLSGSC
jgi:Tfp pilus assembly protein PilF